MNFQSGKLGISILLLGLTCCVVYSVYIYIDCERRKVPPSAPVFPASKLISFSAQGTERYPLYRYSYVSQSHPDDVIEFYAAKSRCNTDVGTLCIHEKNEEKYIVIIASEQNFQLQGFTKYSIEIWWRTCEGPALPNF